MLNHISIGVADIERSARFCDAALVSLGYRRLSDSAAAVGYGKDGHAAFWLLSGKPVPPDGESGLHFCLDAPTRESVAAFHQAAISTGGRDNGAPGVRSEYAANYYAAFVFDPDGYRLEAYCSGA